MSTQSPYPKLTFVNEGLFRHAMLSDAFRVSLNLLTSGVKIGDHVHEDDVYNFVIKGELELTRDGATETYVTGEWLFVPAGQVHAVETRVEVTLLELWSK